MEEYIYLLGQATALYLGLIIGYKILSFIWYLNIFYFTWIYQLYDYLKFLVMFEYSKYKGIFITKDQAINLIKSFNNPEHRASKSVFAKYAIKYLENYIKEFDL